MNTIAIHLREAKYEFLKTMRMPAFVIPTLTFPVAFYLFFGIAFSAGKAGGVSMAKYLLATYGTFGMIGASLFGFGVGLAIERGQGWMLVKRTTPLPMSAYFFAKMVMALLFSAIIISMLFTLGVTAGGVKLSFATGASMFAVLMFGSVTFCALGLALGYFCTPNASAPIVNLVYLPMAFLSGLWVPITFLPKALQQFAIALPPYHLSQIALRTIGAEQSRLPTSIHIGALVLATAIFLAIAAVGARRERE